jgi:18S rRNA (adenine1779-N6/adenine1780-N6)-dimethyltransferase
MFCRLSLNTQLLGRVDHLIKVGKNNFRPPPKVESSVVRIEPHNPPPPIDFLEWDGFVRLCFLRPNKTIGSIFKQNSVLELLGTNYETHCKIQGKESELETDPNFVIDSVKRILTETEMDNARASKMNQDEFLRLMAAFNEAGFHFTS